MRQQGRLSFNATIRRDIVAYYAKAQPIQVNYNDATVKKEIVNFYEVLELKWKSVTSIFELLAELFEIAVEGAFYVRAPVPGTGGFGVPPQMGYFSFYLEWPLYGYHYEDVQV